MSQPNSILEAFQPLLPQLAPGDVALFVAIVERLAAKQYRVWAAQTQDHVEREGLLACAAREDEIAHFIESLEDHAHRHIAELHAQFPDLAERYASVMAGRPRAEQLRIQAEGELGGADFMRQFASAAIGAVAARFISLAECEEANSCFLSALLGSR